MMRRSNFELLRIISMMAIVSSHFFYGDFTYASSTITFNRVLCQISQVGGGFGNIVFILISGYFMVESEFKISKILRIWLEMFFYSVVCCLAALFVNPSAISLKTCIKAFFPFCTGQYWFMTAYIILMFLTPWINIMIKNISKEHFQRLLFLLMLFASIIPSLPGCPKTIISDVGFYIFIYLIAAYIRLYPCNYFENIRMIVLGGGSSFMTILASIIIMDIGGFNSNLLAEKANFLAEMRSPFVLICAVSAFLLFKNINLPNSITINYIARSTLAIFLIHNNHSIREYMWNKMLKNTQYVNSPFLVLYELYAVMVVMIACTLIDIIRREILEKPIFFYINRTKGKQI